MTARVSAGIGPKPGMGANNRVTGLAIFCYESERTTSCRSRHLPRLCPPHETPALSPTHSTPAVVAQRLEGSPLADHTHTVSSNVALKVKIVVANAAIVPAGTDGAISVFVTNQTHVILDINGYFAP